MSHTDEHPVFDLADLAALRAALSDQRLPPPPVYKRHPDDLGQQLPPPPNTEIRGSVRGAIRLFGLPRELSSGELVASELPPLPRPGEPVAPLVELDAYYRENCEARRRHGHPARTMLDFWADEILFLPWRWGADFRRSVAREAAVAAFRQLVQQKVATLLLSAEAGVAAILAVPAGSDVDGRELQLPRSQHEPVGNEHIDEAQHELVGNELDDEALVTEILQLMVANTSRPDAINRVYLRAERMKPDTSDKQVKARLRRKVDRRQRGM